jgi:hypothetical protein
LTSDEGFSEPLPISFLDHSETTNEKKKQLMKELGFLALA